MMNEGRPNPAEQQFSKNSTDEKGEAIDVDKQRVLQAQERYKEDLEQKLGAYKDVPFEVYNDAIALETKIGYDEAEFEGRPKYWSFLKDCDYCCQMALMHEADTIVFFDKSARGFGMLAHKILPIIALEKAINEGLNPNEIKIPKIEFFNPPSHRMGEDIGIMTPENLEDLRTRIQSGERILFFDESSQISARALNADALYENSIDQHRWDRGQIENVYVPKKRGGWGGTLPFFAQTLTSGMQPEDESRCLGFIGSSERAGGQEYPAVKKNIDGSYPHPGEYFYNITEPGPKDPFHVSSARVYGKDVTILRKQVRNEHTRMAWELFSEVILKEDRRRIQFVEEVKKAKKQELADWGVTARMREAAELGNEIMKSLIADGYITDDINKNFYPVLDKELREIYWGARKILNQEFETWWKPGYFQYYIDSSSKDLQKALDKFQKDDSAHKERREMVEKMIQIFQDVLLILKEHKDG